MLLTSKAIGIASLRAGSGVFDSPLTPTTTAPCADTSNRRGPSRRAPAAGSVAKASLALDVAALKAGALREGPPRFEVSAQGAVVVGVSGESKTPLPAQSEAIHRSRCQQHRLSARLGQARE